MDLFQDQPSFRTARGTVEHWQDQRLFRDAMIRLERFRDHHARAHQSEPHSRDPLDLGIRQRTSIDTLEEQLEWQKGEPYLTDDGTKSFVYVPVDLIDDDLTPELKRLQNRFPNVTFVRGQPRPWYLDISDAEPMLWPEIQHVTVAAPDRSRIITAFRGKALDERHALRVVNDHTEYQCLIEKGRVRDEHVREHIPQPPGSEHLYWSQPHDIEAVALLAPKRLL